MKKIIISILCALVIFIATFGYYTENEYELVITNNTINHFTVEIKHYTFTSNTYGDIVQSVDRGHDQLESIITNHFIKANVSSSATPLDLVIHLEDSYPLLPSSNNQSSVLGYEPISNLHDLLIEKCRDHYHIIIRKKHVFEQFWDYLYGFVKHLFKNRLTF